MKKLTFIIPFYCVGGLFTLLVFLWDGFAFIALPFIALAVIGTVQRAKSNRTPGETAKPQNQVTTPPIPTPQPQTPPIEQTAKTYKVAGVSFYEADIMELASENMDFDSSMKEMVEMGYENERIYRYDFYASKIDLIPEPDNPHDSNAIKVIVDGVHVGYIKAGSCSHVHKLLKEDRIVKIDCEINGGRYKYLGYDEDEDNYYLEKGDCPLYVHLRIVEK